MIQTVLVVDKRMINIKATASKYNLNLNPK